ncbi:MAG: hypothetical protein WD691_08640 [Acidimicrobiales bacterium]
MDDPTADGLRRLAARVHPGGVYALWSDDPSDDAYQAVWRQVFAACAAQVATFPNHHTGRDASNTVYVASGTLAP